MMNQEHFDKLGRMFLRARYNQALYESTEIQISHQKAEITMMIEDKYHHALGAIHGSVYFKLLDDACFFAVNSIVEDVFVLTTSFHIQLLRPVSSGQVKAIGELKFASKNSFISDSTLYNEEGKAVAYGTGNFVRSRAELKEDLGYY